MSIFIRSLESDDKKIWSELWQGYLTFYQADISDEQTELTWQRLLDSNYTFQTSTWALTGYCYLEDLFTHPDFRGKGVGRALIEAVKEVAVSNRCSRVYWNTDESNATARALYDTFSPVSSKRQYRIKL